jgi:hypothetical protein
MPRPFPLVTEVRTRAVLRRSRYVRTLPWEALPLAGNYTRPRATKLSSRTVVVACTATLRDLATTAEGWGSTRNGNKAPDTAWAILKAPAELCAGAVAEPDPTRWTTKAVGAVAATALIVSAAGAAIRCTRSTRAVLAAQAGTALRVLPTLLVQRLTQVVGSSLTDA